MEVQALLRSKEEAANQLWDEHLDLKRDSKALMYGRIVNKHARHNLCFADTSQEPDYKKGKGRVMAFGDLPLTNMVREALPNFLGPKAQGLVAEGNYYYDVKKCGVTWHGDRERKKVVGVRLGCSLPLHFAWFQDKRPVSETLKLSFSHGDVYVMSEKTVGSDWKNSKILTLRHAAGAPSFLTLSNVMQD